MFVRDVLGYGRQRNPQGMKGFRRVLGVPGWNFRQPMYCCFQNVGVGCIRALQDELKEPACFVA